ncbi:MAG: class I SAM-dependent methyltransferase, partial [Oscillospiraceae bacterium]|nr:class I SAM-dependent methyltransferase [Oscillospiraceae bacterium]
MIPAEKITKAISPFGLSLKEEQLQKFDTYGEFLVEYNNKVNLTAITAPDEIAVKHFADSIIPLALTEINEGASLIDVGTGAGFPGVALKVARPDIELTLLDSLNKRLVFLGELSEKLGQQNKLVHSRAENAGV